MQLSTPYLDLLMCLLQHTQQSDTHYHIQTFRLTAHFKWNKVFVPGQTGCLYMQLTEKFVATQKQSKLPIANRTTRTTLATVVGLCTTNQHLSINNRRKQSTQTDLVLPLRMSMFAICNRFL